MAIYAPYSSTLSMKFSKISIAAFIFLLFSAFFCKINAQVVLINEIMSDNDLTIEDGLGDFTDWIEIFNPNDTSVNLGAYYLSDDAGDPLKWEIPDLNLQAGGFQLVFASGMDTVILPRQWSTLISWGDEWNYLPGLEEPTSSWIDAGFDDSGWLVGKTGIGYDDGDDSTIIEPTLSLYCRKNFEVEDAAAVVAASFDIDYDDGFVAYLNGVEIARANVEGNPPSFDQEATVAQDAVVIEGGKPARFKLTEQHLALLQDGGNLLAVQVHNANITSSDLSFIPFFSIASPGNPGGPGPDPFLELESHGGLYHANFKIDSDGEDIFLSSPGRILIDSVKAVDLKGDQSFGREEDGSDIWKVFHQPSPGSSNNLGNALFFSHERGFHQKAFYLKIQSERVMTIRYTLNGSEPKAESPIFPDSLLVDSRENSPNVFSMIPTTQPPPMNVLKAWEPPPGLSNKTVVFKCRSFSDGAATSPVYAATFIVDPLGSDRYSLPVFSFMTDSLNLFDYDSGIFVPGIFADPEDNRTGNFFERGKEWEKPVHIEYFEANGETALVQDGGLRIHGQYSRRAAQKSLRLYARNDYGKKYFTHPMLPGRDHDSYKRLILRTTMTTFDSRYGDAFIADLLRDLDFEIQDYQPVIVFMNGEYWGIHNMREYIDEHYINALYPEVHEDSVNILRMNGQVMEGNNQNYWPMIDFVKNNDLGESDNFEHILSLIDYSNYLDYTVTEIFLANIDWPGNNVIYWQSQSEGSKWRWILNDLDASFVDPERNLLAQATDSVSTRWPNPQWSTLFFRSMLKNETFRSDFICRSMELLQEEFHPDQVIGRIPGYRDRFVPEMEEHILRWNHPSSEEQWTSYYDSVMVRFANTRPVYFLNQMTDIFGISEEEICELCGCCDPLSSLDVQFLQPAMAELYASPADVRVEATSLNGSPATRVSLFLDGNFIASDDEAPFQWDPAIYSELSDLPVGEFDLKILAYDADGLSTATDWTSFSIALFNPGDSVDLGNEVDSAGTADVWTSNMVINKTDIYTNPTDTLLYFRPDEFSFFADQLADPVTPFIVRVNGKNDFTVLAIGDTRTSEEYVTGENRFSFRENRDTTLILAAGETVATGFLDALPDGLGGGSGPVIPYNTTDPVDDVWYTGSPEWYKSGSVTEGLPPAYDTPPRTFYKRNYHYKIGFTIADTVEVYGTGILDLPVLDLVMFPNPVSGEFVNLSVNGVSGPVQVSIFDLQGRILYTQKHYEEMIQIETGLLPGKGTYLVKVESRDGLVFGKLINLSGR